MKRKRKMRKGEKKIEVGKKEGKGERKKRGKEREN